MRQRESGAVKVHTLVAPRLGNGSDGKGISVLRFGVFPCHILAGKSPDEGGNVR